MDLDFIVLDKLTRREVAKKIIVNKSVDYHVRIMLESIEDASIFGARKFLVGGERNQTRIFPIGFLAYACQEDALTIKAFQIAGNLQRNGVGTRFLDYLYSIEQSAVVLCESKLNSEGFWEKKGFVCDGESEGYKQHRLLLQH